MNPDPSTMSNAETRSILTDRLAAVEERIRAACKRANRARDQVTLVAVTKSASIEAAAMLPELGVKDLGESRPQELWRKAEAIRDVRWHLIGHLQRNKVERTLPLVHLIHSVDSERLLDAVQTEVRRNGQPEMVLLEVNLSREPNKHGFSKEQMFMLDQAVFRARGYAIICGLMTMAAHTDDPEKSRATFAELRQLRDQLRARWSGYGAELIELSMGMTNDFEVAIEEGATLVRIGSALFEGLPSS
jgi:pyridoxal phosphate enzyme (YggS family)